MCVVEGLLFGTIFTSMNNPYQSHCERPPERETSHSQPWDAPPSQLQQRQRAGRPNSELQRWPVRNWWHVWCEGCAQSGALKNGTRAPHIGVHDGDAVEKKKLAVAIFHSSIKPQMGPSPTLRFNSLLLKLLWRYPRPEWISKYTEMVSIHQMGIAIHAEASTFACWGSYNTTLTHTNMNPPYIIALL